MNKFVMTAIAASLALAAPVFADDAHHPEKNQVTKDGASQTSTQGVRKMQENVKKMQAQLDRVAKAGTEEERQKAMAEHMQTMQESMQMGRSMQAGKMGCPMMEGGMAGMAGKGGMAGSGEMMMKRMDMMEKRMDMMQMMMQGGMGRPPGEPAKPAN